MENKLSDYLNKESKIKGLDDITILNGIPLWRIVRTKYRRYILKENSKTVIPIISYSIIVYYFKSLLQLLWLLLKRKKCENLFFPHPRLFKVNELYIERLTDPVIDYSNLQNDYIIFERHQNGIHRKPRIHADKVIIWDFITLTVVLVTKIFRHIIALKYKKQINQLKSILKTEFEVDEEAKKIILNQLCEFVISYQLSKPILKVLSPKRVFFAPRSTFQFIIACCKKYNIMTYELEHGITVCENTLYSGTYCPSLDPDYFLTFGRDCTCDHFGMPSNRIINIGFAYKNYITDLLKKQNIPSRKRILVISEPHISSIIVDVVIELSKRNKEYTFDIRCHPQERIKGEDKEKIDFISNVNIVDNQIESFLALSQYKYIIGENSSVIFEALSLGKKVGRLNFNGLKVELDNGIVGGDIINSFDEFESFLYSNKPSPNKLELYSDFEREIVNNLT